MLALSSESSTKNIGPIVIYSSSQLTFRPPTSTALVIVNVFSTSREYYWHRKMYSHYVIKASLLILLHILNMDVGERHIQKVL